MLISSLSQSQSRLLTLHIETNGFSMKITEILYPKEHKNKIFSEFTLNGWKNV